MASSLEADSALLFTLQRPSERILKEYFHFDTMGVIPPSPCMPLFPYHCKGWPNCDAGLPLPPLINHSPLPLLLQRITKPSETTFQVTWGGGGGGERWKNAILGVKFHPQSFQEVTQSSQYNFCSPLLCIFPWNLSPNEFHELLLNQAQEPISE